MRELYKITKQPSNFNTVIKSKDGRPLTSSEEQLDRWKEHFSNLLGPISEQNFDNDQPEPTIEMPINCNTPTKTEIQKAIKTPKNNKAAGPDSVPADLLKADPRTAADILHPLITRAWVSNIIPDEWKQGLIIKLPKKGDTTNCDNWRDFVKAFDSIPHAMVWKTLKEKGIPEKLINIIKELYRNTECNVLHNGRTSDSFNLGIGVKQGCTLSPLLFNIVLDSVLTKATANIRGSNVCCGRWK
ncbi:uncharacterized protein LOC115886670 [Sitophilus oryzae]|uniref:Uncharacterized protein LOC115886670 n=1 Tax=Sitophilus oryzae TaxID=7048 RepID=A0A6J2YD25_SITOR|nr:uncharacterized protein LOC115886670 [Sitophilus oryzae]